MPGHFECEATRRGFPGEMTGAFTCRFSEEIPILSFEDLSVIHRPTRWLRYGTGGYAFPTAGAFRKRRLWSGLMCVAFALAGVAGCGGGEEAGRGGGAPDAGDAAGGGTPAAAGVDEAATVASPEPAREDAPSDFALPPDDMPAESRGGNAAGTPEFRLPPDLSGDESSSAVGPAGGDGPTLASWAEVKRSVETGGRVTVVDLWSLACPPCLAEFPGLVALHEELGGRVRCVGVDLDFDGRRTRPAESYRPRVTEFLESVDATFENYISTTPIDDVLADIDAVSIPTVLVYDAQGTLVRRFVDAGDTAGFSYEDDVTPFVRKLAG